MKRYRVSFRGPWRDKWLIWKFIEANDRDWVLAWARGFLAEAEYDPDEFLIIIQRDDMRRGRRYERRVGK